MPGTFAESPDGLVYYADGLGPVLRWDSFTAQMEEAGVNKPATAPTLAAGAARGGILGTYRAYARFLDRYGNTSDLSPISAEATVQLAAAAAVTALSSTSPVVVTSPGHGLTTGARVTLSGSRGLTSPNGTWDVTVLDNDRFSLDNSASDGVYTGGASYVTGAGSIVYTSAPLPADGQVRRRQLLRNTAGQLQTFYVDVDTADLTQTTFTSTLTDTLLAAQLAVPVTDDASDDLGNLSGRPPQTKRVIAHHQGRMFAAGEVEYAEGAVALTFGLALVTGIGTEWQPAVAGRFLYVVGGNDRYEIQSVDQAAQTLTLVTPYTGSTDPFAAYAIRPAPAEANLVYFSEGGRPEAWPVTNAFSTPDDGDQTTGLMSYHSFIYVLKRRSIYRYTFQSEPLNDGALFLNGSRGCVNDRCWVRVEDAVYLMDEDGVHMLDGGKSSDGSISGAIQTLFRPDGEPRINWSASRYFHACHDPATETVRWFVALSGQYLPRHAICYQYTLDRWWIEEWRVPVGSSCLGKLARTSAQNTWGYGRQQLFLGSDARRVLAFAGGPLDGCDPAGVNAGAVVSAGRLSLTAADIFEADVVGCPVAIVTGRGRGQVRMVASVSGATLKIKQPWLVTPDSTSTFQLGAIPWEWRSGWFRWSEEELNNPRRVELCFEPTAADQTMTLRRYRDRSDTPVPVAAGRSDDGVRLAAGSPDADVSLDRPTGFVQARLDAGRETFVHGPRLISLGLSGQGGAESVKVYQVTIDGAKDSRGG